MIAHEPKIPIKTYNAVPNHLPQRLSRSRSLFPFRLQRTQKGRGGQLLMSSWFSLLSLSSPLMRPCCTSRQIAEAVVGDKRGDFPVEAFIGHPPAARAL